MAIFRHVLSGTTPGEIWSFTLHTEGSLDVDAAATAFTSASTAFWTGSMDALFATDVVATQASTATLSEATGGQITRRITGLSLPGTATEEMLPFQVAVVVSLRSALATRSGRGRFYLPPLTTASLESGRLVETDQSAVANYASTYLQALDTAGLAPVIWGRTSLTATPVTELDVGDVFDTQRRRRGSLIESRQTRTL